MPRFAGRFIFGSWIFGRMTRLKRNIGIKCGRLKKVGATGCEMPKNIRVLQTGAIGKRFVI